MNWPEFVERNKKLSRDELIREMKEGTVPRVEKRIAKPLPRGQKVQTTLYLPRGMHRDLKLFAEARKESMAMVVMEALRKYGIGKAQDAE